jgi:hypothetical protein
MLRSLVFESIRTRFCTRGSLRSIIIISLQRSWVLLGERHTLFDVLREIWDVISMLSSGQFETDSPVKQA